MTKADDHRIGITPIVLRRAAYYVTLGVGTYFPDHPHFDRVEVRKTYDFVPSQKSEYEWSLGLEVAFYRQERKIRWVEFGCRTVGAGGDDILRVVSEDEECLPIS